MSSLSILIVEDEPLTAMAEQTMVQDLGHRVAAISLSGEAAVESVEREQPDLVLMDIKLSGDMDGTQAARIIREERDIPIIFITAYGDKGCFDPDELDIPEGYGYIVKPFTGAELSNAIRKLIGNDPA